MKIIFYASIYLIMAFSQLYLFAQEPRKTIMLNGIVEFEQTETAMLPKKFSRKIPVPGLIDLAVPKIEQYEAYFTGKHKPMYSWYRFTFTLDDSYMNRYGILKILKSNFNTQITLNEHDCGTFMQCNTPIEADLTKHLKYNEENVLLIRIGDRAFLPKESALGIDREKFTDIPGIWDDVFITFTGPVQINRVLILPELSKSKITAKIKLENLADWTDRDMEMSKIHYTLKFLVREKVSKKIVAAQITKQSLVQCLQQEELVYELPFTDFQSWSPENPFLYEFVATVSADSIHFSNYGNTLAKKIFSNRKELGNSDSSASVFGMRDFFVKGRVLELNGVEYKMFGSTLTLNRFFEDKERSDLPWNKEWVKKLLVTIPKSLGWNTFRVSLGLLPSFWYDLADEYGLLIQNEYPMWNLRGRESQLLSEYSDWVWSDGNHPSIVIWDALNENVQNYIGKELLPKLKKIDPTRIWDAGWIGVDGKSKVDMLEIHWYTLGFGWWSSDDFVNKQRTNYSFGALSVDAGKINAYSKSNVPLVLNEYGWLWLDRNGNSAIRTRGNFTAEDITPSQKNYEYFERDGSQLYDRRDVYDYYLGSKSTSDSRWKFQAYLLGIETETARAANAFSGIISFSYLTNNKGYTGDWFKGKIKELVPTQGLVVQSHSMKPFAVFLDVEDGRFLKNRKSYEAGISRSINLFVVNDHGFVKRGEIEVRLINSSGEAVWLKKMQVEANAYSQKMISVIVDFPKVNGGYLLQTQLIDPSHKEINQTSIRYLNVGESQQNEFYDYLFEMPMQLKKIYNN